MEYALSFDSKRKQQLPPPGFYWAKNGQWEIIFIRSDGLVDARGKVQDQATSDLYLECQLKELLPPSDLPIYRAWAAAEVQREPVKHAVVDPELAAAQLVAAAYLALQLLNELEASLGQSFDELSWGAHLKVKKALVEALGVTA